ncbi:MAG: acyl-CoA dehydrogenase [Holophagales bacterium]|nr:acyl-CoA dehydrogenase [Holophagales bacterium]
MSETERTALEAGDVWLDAELFSGRPDLSRLMAEPYPRLTEVERAFLDGPVAEVCSLMDPEFTERTKQLPEAVWTHLREHRFFGLCLPEEHGGHGFSALAASSVFGKLGSRSMALSSVVLIPNSVGPGELLLEVGTPEQKAYYLPRLAGGEEIPCFALTEPDAGSDAAALTSRGVLFRGTDGELHIRLRWHKRYITLAPIATLLGLAFRLHDPENLLGRGEDLGITCALVPTDLPGVEIGRYHDPLGVPFPNGPTRGENVVIPASQIIGGLGHAGRGWQMLMEALSGGRAISLPAQSAVGTKYVARVAGAYSAVRRQFGAPIGRFEGIEEPLARIAGRAYLLEAARVFTCGAIDAGRRPAVISAMMKYASTELCRQSALDGMDVLGGAAICLGPRNLMAEAYRAAPIGITVEGANILTRTLIVFGQGAIRCHPHAHRLLEAIREDDVPTFRRALFGQAFHVMANAVRSAFLGLTGGWPVAGAAGGDPTARYRRRLAWASARFAFYADLAMLVLGGRLKTRGKLTGRLADMLAWMYLLTATLRRFEAEGRQQADLPFVRWAGEEALQRIQIAFEGLVSNFDAPLLGAWLRGPVLWWSRLRPLSRGPSDRLGQQVARRLQQPGAARDRLTPGLHLEPGSALAALEVALESAVAAEPSLVEIRRAVRTGRLGGGSMEELAASAQKHGIITDEGRRAIERAAADRREAVRVDDFDLHELRLRHGMGGESRAHTGARRDVAGG